jgi:hypothetical protein
MRIVNTQPVEPAPDPYRPDPLPNPVHPPTPNAPQPHHVPEEVPARPQPIHPDIPEEPIHPPRM